MKKVEKLLKAHDKKAAAEQALLERVAKGLEDIVPARRMEFTEEEEAALCWNASPKGWRILCRPAGWSLPRRKKQLFTTCIC